VNSEDLAETYHRYLDCLNQRRWDDLGEFVSPDVVHNGRAFGLAGYRAMLEEDVATIPDLRFDADIVVTDRDVVASRLVFRCTPERTFLGFEPTGARITFSEHVFYRFHDGVITDVRSLIDYAAVAAQFDPRGRG
jgi:predicted ester cyclase